MGYRNHSRRLNSTSSSAQANWWRAPCTSALLIRHCRWSINLRLEHSPIESLFEGPFVRTLAPNIGATQMASVCGMLDGGYLYLRSAVLAHVPQLSMSKYTTSLNAQ